MTVRIHVLHTRHTTWHRCPRVVHCRRLITCMSRDAIRMNNPTSVKRCDGQAANHMTESISADPRRACAVQPISASDFSFTHSSRIPRDRPRSLTFSLYRQISVTLGDQLLRATSRVFALRWQDDLICSTLHFLLSTGRGERY